ncbi:MAG: membrane protein of unknown function [Promethearchaeota archaeon]|nr:MAG: membrane protein of unknown function [Candidatus Lokiarchaeota archaeon]
MKEFHEYKGDINEFEYLMNRWCIPRLAGSEGSFEVVKRLKQDFAQFNVDSLEQEFAVHKSNKSFKLSNFFYGFSLLSLIFLLFLISLFWFTIIIGILIMLYFIKERNLFLKKNPCLRRREKEADPEAKVAFTQSNLIYRLKPTKTKKYNVVLLSHHDSKSQYLSTYIRAYFALIFLIVVFFALLAYITVIILERRGILEMVSYGLKLYIFIVGWLTVSFFFTLATNYISNESPGALDNASGLYSVWKTAQYLNESPFSHIEVWFILTGAEEIDQEGAAAFLNKYRSELSPENTLIINFDMVGLKNNPLEVVDSFYVPKEMINPFLIQLIEESAEKLDIKLKRWYLWIGGYSDGMLFQEEGFFRTINFITKKASKYAHQKKDTYDLIDPFLIDQQAKLVVEMITGINRYLE